MAGSYENVTTGSGSLMNQKNILESLDIPVGGDAYEAIEEMYGMIWYLAGKLVEAEVYSDPLDAVEEASTFHEDGLKESPTERFR